MNKLVSMMQKALDGAWQRHDVLSGNIANAETPGYKRQDVDFLSVLQNTERKLTPLSTHPLHLSLESDKKFLVSEDPTSVSPDGNGVDIDKEMAEVAANTLYYTAVSRQLSGYLSLIRRAVTEGRR